MTIRNSVHVAKTETRSDSSSSSSSTISSSSSSSSSSYSSFLHWTGFGRRVSVLGSSGKKETPQKRNERRLLALLLLLLQLLQLPLHLSDTDIV